MPANDVARERITAPVQCLRHAKASTNSSGEGVIIFTNGIITDLLKSIKFQKRHYGKKQYNTRPQIMEGGYAENETLSCMRYGWNRYFSFVFYPHIHLLHVRFLPFLLVKRGFWYNRAQSIIQCFYCRAQFDPFLEERMRHARICNRFAVDVPIGHPAGSIAICAADLSVVMSGGPREQVFNLHIPEARILGGNSYNDRDERLRSFHVHFAYQRDDFHEDFADAGFFAYGGDLVCCFLCRVLVPAVQLCRPAFGSPHRNYAVFVHSQLMPDCPFVRQTVQTEAQPQPPPTLGTPERGGCFVCVIRPADVAFFPCGHLAACALCAYSLQACPSPGCGVPVQRQERVYRQ